MLLLFAALNLVWVILFNSIENGASVFFSFGFPKVIKTYIFIKCYNPTLVL